eukprot:2778197-Pleurochrysis_carterae.AAC.1
MPQCSQSRLSNAGTKRTLLSELDKEAPPSAPPSPPSESSPPQVAEAVAPREGAAHRPGLALFLVFNACLALLAAVLFAQLSFESGAITPTVLVHSLASSIAAHATPVMEVYRLHRASARNRSRTHRNTPCRPFCDRHQPTDPDSRAAG